MTLLAFYDKCKGHGVTSEKQAWALAAQLDARMTPLAFYVVHAALVVWPLGTVSEVHDGL